MTINSLNPSDVMYYTVVKLRCPVTYAYQRMLYIKLGNEVRINEDVAGPGTSRWMRLRDPIPYIHADKLFNH